jgi:hypothetical protein
MRRNSIDLALFLLSNYDNIDMTDITTNPSVVSRISWVARRQGVYFRFKLDSFLCVSLMRN